MSPTYEMCRTQEARQQAIADNATLDNTRVIATRAAAAWGKEALAAAKREKRVTDRKAAAEDVPDDDLPSTEDRAFSENPDRGFAVTNV